MRFLGAAPSRSNPAVLDASTVLVLLAGLFGCLLSALGLVGCERQERVELLELTSVGPDVVEAGRRIIVEGRGFPLGADARLVLSGTLYEVGDHREVNLTLPAEIVSGERAEALVTGAFLDDVGAAQGRGTFRGSVSLLVPMADASGQVSGSQEDVVLDLAPSAGDPDLDEVIGVIDLPPVGESLGMTLEAVDGEPGAVVTAVREAGPASQMGLRVGDVIVGLDGMRILFPEDLAGWSDAVQSIEVQNRAGDGPTLTLRAVPLEPVRLDGTLRAMQLAVLLLAMLVLLWERDRTVTRRQVRLEPRALFVPALLLLLFHFLTVSMALDQLSMLLAPAVASVVVASSVVGEAMRSPWVVASSFGRALLLLLVVLACAASMGTVDLGELESAQTLLPTGWLVVSMPVAPAFAVLLAFALPPSLPVSSTLTARVVSRLAEVLVSALVVTTLAGGRGPSGAIGAALFVLRGVAVLGGLFWVRTVLAASPLRTQFVLLFGALVAVGLGTLFAMHSEPAPMLGRACAELWLAALALAALLHLRPRPAPLLQAEMAL